MTGCRTPLRHHFCLGVDAGDGKCSSFRPDAPRDFRSIIPLFRPDAGLAREPALLLELGLDVRGELLGGAARLQLYAAFEKTVVQIGRTYRIRDGSIQSHEGLARGPGRRNEAVEGDV